MKAKVIILLVLIFCQYSSVCQELDNRNSTYFVIEVQFSPSLNEINVLRIALVPKKKNSIKQLKNIINLFLKSKELDVLKHDYTLYNYLPRFPDSYLLPINHSDELEFELNNDAIGENKLLLNYISFCEKFNNKDILNQTVWLRNDSMSIKVFKIKGKRFVTRNNAALYFISSNKSIREALRANNHGVNEGISDTKTMKEDKPYIISDVFIPCTPSLVLNGGEARINLKMDFKMSNTVIMCLDKRLLKRSELLKLK